MNLDQTSVAPATAQNFMNSAAGLTNFASSMYGAQNAFSGAGGMQSFNASPSLTPNFAADMSSMFMSNMSSTSSIIQSAMAQAAAAQAMAAGMGAGVYSSSTGPVTYQSSANSTTTFMSQSIVIIPGATTTTISTPCIPAPQVCVPTPITYTPPVCTPPVYTPPTPPVCTPTPTPPVCPAPTPVPTPAPTPAYTPISGLCVPFNGLNLAGAGYFGSANNIVGSTAGYTQGQLAQKVVVPTYSQQYGNLGPQNYLGTTTTRTASSGNVYGRDTYATPQGTVGFTTVRGVCTWTSPTTLRA